MSNFMISKTNFQSTLILFGIPLLMILSLFLITKSSWFLQYPKELSIGVTLDLLVTMPLVYFFLIRKREIPKTTVIFVFILGFVSAGFILPINKSEF